MIMVFVYMFDVDVGYYFDGVFVVGCSGCFQDVFNFVFGCVVCCVVFVGYDEVEWVVVLVCVVFLVWVDMLLICCVCVLYCFLQLMNEYCDMFVVIIIVEYGKVFLDVQGEVVCGIDIIEFVCGVL